ncbi:MAG: hypothetical protein HYU52_12335 [Acidobacteria bacterium]|nr:hypothetical protein [Acidobacteriota bacterium]
MTKADPVLLAAAIGQIFDRLDIRYVVGGSVASGLLGEPRSTFDVDLMARLSEPQARAFVGALGPDYYVDEETVLDAVRRRTAFNIIHITLGMKVDIFVAEDAPFADRQLERSTRMDVMPGVSVSLYSPEDLIVRKLMWFRAGNGISDRQWRDVTGLIKARATLDLTYLRASAAEQGLSELLAEALSQAGIDSV